MSDWKTAAEVMARTTGMSWRQIAKELGVPKSSCSDHLRKALKKQGEEEKEGPRVLVLDIETKYMLMGGWGLYNQNFSIDQIEEDWSILSYSAKWFDSDEVMYSDVSEKTEDCILAELHDLLCEANFIIAHNGRRFDLKKIRARMVARGFPPHSPVKVIDTLEIARKEFSFSSNKLLYLTKLLCKSNQKLEHEKFAGYKLWKEFVAGNPEAVKSMREYNIVDVTSLQELYNILAPWSSSLPNFQVFYEEPSLDDWEECGYTYSNLGKYQQYRNKKTGQYRRGRVNLLTKEQRKNLLANIV